MSRVVLAIVIGAAMAMTSLQVGSVRAQAPAAETKKADDAKTKAEQRKADRKAKADARKAKSEERKKARAERKASASQARAALRERQKQCGAEWKEARAAGKVDKFMTWPKYWSACNTRLKGKAA